MPWPRKPPQSTLPPMARVSGKADESQRLKLLGQAIRARREARSMSQEALADGATMDRSHIGRIERGERNVTLLNLIKIAATLDCRASDLMAAAGL
jgi:ribosome-binding protein aMBF1 (putative translation factor)